MHSNAVTLRAYVIYREVFECTSRDDGEISDPARGLTDGLRSLFSEIPTDRG